MSYAQDKKIITSCLIKPDKQGGQAMCKPGQTQPGKYGLRVFIDLLSLIFHVLVIK